MAKYFGQCAQIQVRLDQAQATNVQTIVATQDRPRQRQVHAGDTQERCWRAGCAYIQAFQRQMQIRPETDIGRALQTKFEAGRGLQLGQQQGADAFGLHQASHQEQRGHDHADQDQRDEPTTRARSHARAQREMSESGSRASTKA